MGCGLDARPIVLKFQLVDINIVFKLYSDMNWKIEFHDEFEEEFDNLAETVRDAIFVKASLLEQIGPSLGRPHADTLNGSIHGNMKELRCKVNKANWRILFAFDPDRKAILLVAGNKTGANQKRFYEQLIARADERFNQYLALRKGGNNGQISE